MSPRTVFQYAPNVRKSCTLELSSAEKFDSEFKFILLFYLDEINWAWIFT